MLFPIIRRASCRERVYQEVGPEFDEEEQDPYADEELAAGRILDAIPLERTRRRSPVGYR